jgi:hypothetical protein
MLNIFLDIVTLVIITCHRIVNIDITCLVMVEGKEERDIDDPFPILSHVADKALVA